MDYSFIYDLDAWLFVLILGIMMFLTTKLGYYLANKIHGENKRHDVISDFDISVSKSVFSMTALFLAFSFNMAGNRYDIRRDNIILEAMAIKSAYQCSQMYSESEVIAFKKEFQKYLDVKIAYFEEPYDSPQMEIYVKKANNIGQSIFQHVIRLSHDRENLPATNLMIRATNEMLQSSVIKLMSLQARIPDFVQTLVFVLLFICSFYLGYLRFGRRNIDTIIILGFYSCTLIISYIILDLDRPKRGLIKLKEFNKPMIELRESMR